MEAQSRKLLEECNLGCKMAVNSMNQVGEYVTDKKLNAVLADYKQKHETLQRESARLLHADGEKEKQPGAMASAFSWMTTEMKMMLNDDSNQAAKLMMDGCNMGIQSISECENQCPDASSESRSLARRLVQTEQNFMQEMQQFL